MFCIEHYKTNVVSHCVQLEPEPTTYIAIQKKSLVKEQQQQSRKCKETYTETYHYSGK